jgi:hypothetical protein
VADLSDELKHAWLLDHFERVAYLNESDRRQHLKELIETTQELDDEPRMGLIRNGLLAIVDLPDDEAAPIIESWQAVMDRMDGNTAFTEVTLLQSAARQMPVQDSQALAEIWPRIFGKDLAGA